MSAQTNCKKFGSSDFHGLMKELLRTMQMESVVGPDPEVYSFTFDRNLEINIFSRSDGVIDMLAEPGIVHNLKAHDLLLELMTLNRHDTQAYSLSLCVERKSGKVTLWTRWPLANLQPGDLSKLLEHMLSRAEEVRRHLEAPTLVLGGGTRVERALLTHLAREGKHHE